MKRNTEERLLKAKVLRFARGLGIKLTRRREPTSPRVLPDAVYPGEQHGWFSWDGHSLETRRRDAEELCHEVAHWLIASRSRLRCPEYALGPHPWGFAAIPPRIVGDRLQHREEAQATLLGFALCILCGESVERMRDLAESSGAIYASHSLMATALRRVRANGHWIPGLRAASREVLRVLSQADRAQRKREAQEVAKCSSP